MKGHKISPKHIHHKAHELVHARKRGGKVAEGSWPHEGEDESEEDIRDEPEDRTEHDKVGKEAEEMHAKRGGHVKKRRRGGKAEHEREERRRGGHVKKHVGHVEGEEHHHHAGRKPRKSGGGCESSPFSSAKEGSPAPGRKLDRETMD